MADLCSELRLFCSGSDGETFWEQKSPLKIQKKNVWTRWNKVEEKVLTCERNELKISAWRRYRRPWRAAHLVETKGDLRELSKQRRTRSQNSFPGSTRAHALHWATTTNCCKASSSVAEDARAKAVSRSHFHWLNSVNKSDTARAARRPSHWGCNEKLPTPV